MVIHNGRYGLMAEVNVFQSESEMSGRGFSLRSVLLIALVIVVGAGVTAYALGSVFAASGSAIANVLQSTKGTDAGTTGHSSNQNAGLTRAYSAVTKP